MTSIRELSSSSHLALRLTLQHVAMIALHVAAGLAVSLWPQPSKVVINDPTLVTFTGNFAFISSGESSDELQNAIHRYTDLLHASVMALYETEVLCARNGPKNGIA